MRRFLACLTASLAFTGTFLVLPVYAAPGPEAAPVESSDEEVPLGSVDAPAPEAEVQEGTTEPVAGVQAQAPVLTVRETDVDEFSLVGVSWARDPAVTDTLVQVRVRDLDGNWGEWTELGTETAEENPDAAAQSTRGGTEALWTGPSDGVEAELVTRSGAQPTDVQLSMIDPGESDADTVYEAPTMGATAHAATSMPAVYSRAQWGADESLKHGGVQYASTLKAATLHHTAGSNSYTAAEVPALLRGMYRYHTVTLGWNDLGYNALVDKYGRIWEGRAGGLSRPVIGAHAGGFNTYTFGVSMIGNYDVVPTTQPMIDSVAAIVGWKLSLHRVDPHGSTSLAGKTLPTVFGHKDTKATACPGKYGYAKLAEIRTKADSRAASAAFVRALYEDMMDRAADARGLASWTSALAAGRNRRHVSDGFANSTEYRGLVIRQGYQQVLGRAPDPRGFDHWMAALRTGKVRLDTVRLALMASKEFYLRGGSSDTAFVNNIYQAALGRGAAAAEVTHWAAVRERDGASTVIRAVWGSPEAGMRRVAQGYDYYLARAASTAERRHWLPVVAGAGDEQLREELVVSKEYLLRAQSRFP